MVDTAKRAAAAADHALRAAVLSVFDLGWMVPDLDDAAPEEADRLATFLTDSCERVVDAHGAARWRLRDDERIRVLRGRPRNELIAALDASPHIPDEPVQRLLEQELRGTLPPVEGLGPADLAALIQLRRWLGPGSGLPTEDGVAARLDWLNLMAPLKRLLTRGFVGREDLLAALLHHVDTPDAEAPFVIQGVGGSGKSTVLARLIEHSTEDGALVCYASFDRSWLVRGGPWALVDEIARQAGMQFTEALSGTRRTVEELRRQIRRYAQRSGWSDVASRSVQQLESVPTPLLKDLYELVGGRRLVLVLDTLEELARRDASLSYACSAFLRQLSDALPGLRVVAAGRALPRTGFVAGRIWTLTGLDDRDGVELLRQLTDMAEEDELLVRMVRATGGNPLSLHLAADVLRRTGSDPMRLIEIGEGDVQGQLYSRLLEHIKDKRAQAIAHPGLVVRRITPEVIRDVLAEPCGLAPLSDADAAAIFWALQSEATLCEPSMDGDGALFHRADVRALMLPAITRAMPAAARMIHEAAVRYYEQLTPSPRTTDLVARREELYHRLMLKQSRPELDRRWLPSVADELAVAMEEMPPESQLYLAGQVKGLRLDPEVRAEADDEQWCHSVRPSVESLLERGQLGPALELLQERRGYDGRVILPDLEIETLERLDRVDEALELARAEQQRGSAVGQNERGRDLVLHQARILERMGRSTEAWDLLFRLVELDRSARKRVAVIDEDVRTRDLVALTSLLRIARHADRTDELVKGLRAETVALAEATPARVLTRSPSLLRDLAAEVGGQSKRILKLASDVRGADAPPPPSASQLEDEKVAYDSPGSHDSQPLHDLQPLHDYNPPIVSPEVFESEADGSQGYL